MAVKTKHKVFVSHGWADRWVAGQISLRLQDGCGCDTFVAAFDMQRGDGIEDRVFAELGQCQEIIALITPWAADRNWLWVEIGAARFAGMRIVAVLYGTTLEEIDRLKGGKTFLEAKYAVEIHEMDAYLSEVKARAAL